MLLLKKFMFLACLGILTIDMDILKTQGIRAFCSFFFFFNLAIYHCFETI